MTMNVVPTVGQVVCLITAPSLTQAHIWEKALRAEGIKFQVVGDFLGWCSADIYGIRPEIWVRRQDFIQARRVLRQSEIAEPTTAALYCNENVMAMSDR
jgi:Putative prokaryotic signal transducing protein